MTIREAFKAGFLLKLAEIGMTPEDLVENIKHAEVDPIGQIVDKTYKFGTGLASTTGKLGLALLLGLPPILGATGGLIASKVTGPSDVDLALAKKKLKLFRYQQMLNEVKQRRVFGR